MTYQEALDYHKEHGKLPDNFCGLTYSKENVFTKRNDTEYPWKIPNWSLVTVVFDDVNGNKVLVIEPNQENEIHNNL